MQKVKANIPIILLSLTYLIALTYIFWIVIVNKFNNLYFKDISLFIILTTALSLHCIVSYRKITSQKKIFTELRVKTKQPLFKGFSFQEHLPEIAVYTVVSIPLLVIAVILITNGELSKNYIYTKEGITFNYYSSILIASSFIFQDIIKVFNIQQKKWTKLFTILSSISMLIGFFFYLSSVTHIVEASI